MKYPGSNITKDNLGEKIKLVRKTQSGRIKISYRWYSSKWKRNKGFI